MIADLYLVLVHGVHIKNVNIIDQGGAIKSLIKQNQSLNPGLTIARVAWPRGVRDTPKLFSSLTVFLRTPKQANQVITRGFTEEGEVKYIERFHTGYSLV